MAKNETTETKKVGYAAFLKMTIRAFRDEKHSPGIDVKRLTIPTLDDDGDIQRTDKDYIIGETVTLASLMRSYYDDAELDTIAITNELAEKKLIVKVPYRRGKYATVRLYLPGEVPERTYEADPKSVSAGLSMLLAQQSAAGK